MDRRPERSRSAFRSFQARIRGRVDRAPTAEPEPAGLALGSAAAPAATPSSVAPPPNRPVGTPVADDAPPAVGSVAPDLAPTRIGRRTAAAPTSGPAVAARDLTGPAGRVIEVERVGPSVAILRIGKPAGLSFTAGQYLRAGLADVRMGKFTIASAPHESHLELCVESIPGGRLTPRLVGLGPGGVVDLSGTAKGGFTLDPSGTTHVMVATGTGIAPFRSMVLDALHRNVPGSFVILHGASYADDLPYLDELTALAASHPQVEYVPTVSRPSEPRNAGWTGRTGRVDALAEELAPGWAGLATRVYACGNSGMVAAVTTAMRQRGLKVSSESFD